MHLRCAALLSLLLGIPAFATCAIAGDPEGSAEMNLLEAKRLLADGFPEYRNKINELINNAIRIAPHSVEAQAALGRFILWEVASGFRPKSDLVLAVELGDQIKELAPQRPLGDYLKCETLFALAQNRQAESDCRLALASYPDHIDTELFRARYFSESNPKAAVEAAQKALAGGANYDELSYVTSNALIRLSGEKSAGEQLARFAAVYPNRWMWHRAGLAYAAEGKTTEAKSAFQQAVALGNDIEAVLSLGSLAQSQLHDFPLAELEYKEILKTLEGKKELSQSYRSNVLARLSLLYLAANRLPDAANAANDAIRADVDNRPLIQVLGETFAGKKLLSLLEEPFRFVAKTNPEFKFGHLMLAEVERGKKSYPEAIRHYGKVLSLEPDDDSMYAARAHAYYEMQVYPDALQDFDTALKLKPQEASHHYNRSCMLSLMGRVQEAFDSLRVAILLDQSLSQLAQNDSDLLNLRNATDFVPRLIALGVFQPSQSEQVKKSVKAGE